MAGTARLASTALGLALGRCGAERGLGLVKADALGRDGVPPSSEAFDEARLQRHAPLPGEVCRVAGTAEQPLHLARPAFLLAHWNYSGLYLAEGSYTFSATGEWQDSKDTCDCKGTEDGQLTAGDLVRAASSFLGEFERLFEKVSKNESTDFFGTKRVENLN